MSKKREKPIVLPPDRADEEVDEETLSILLKEPAPKPKAKKKTPRKK